VSLLWRVSLEMNHAVLIHALLIFEGRLANQRLVDVRDDTAASDGRLDQRVQLFVSSDRQLQVTRVDALHLQVLARVAGQLEHLGRQVLENGGAVDGRGGAHASILHGARLQVPVDTANRELEACSR